MSQLAKMSNALKSEYKLQSKGFEFDKFETWITPWFELT